MDKNNLSQSQRTFRMNIRNFLMVATREELEREQRLSVERGEEFRVACVQELIDEHDDE